MKEIGIHIGKLIESVLNESNMSKSEFARRIHTSRQNITTLLKRSDMDVKQLLTISQVLRYDFMKHFCLEREEEFLPEIEVSIQFKMKPGNLDEFLQLISKNSDIQISRKIKTD